MQCDSCDYDYDGVTPDNAAATLRGQAELMVELIRGADPAALARRNGTAWSALEYAGHVRDVLLVQRERVLQARLDDAGAAVSMGRDERVAWGEYDGYNAARAAEDVSRAAAWLAHTFEQLPPEGWVRTLVYNYPERSARTLIWLAAHTVHEVMHHRHDLARSIRGGD